MSKIIQCRVGSENFKKIINEYALTLKEPQKYINVVEILHVKFIKNEKELLKIVT